MANQDPIVDAKLWWILGSFSIGSMLFFALYWCYRASYTRPVCDAAIWVANAYHRYRPQGKVRKAEEPQASGITAQAHAEAAEGSHNNNIELTEFSSSSERPRSNSNPFTANAQGQSHRDEQANLAQAEDTIMPRIEQGLVTNRVNTNMLHSPWLDLTDLNNASEIESTILTPSEHIEQHRRSLHQAQRISTA